MTLNIFWLLVSIICLVSFFVYLVLSEEYKEQSLSICELWVLIGVASLVSYFSWACVFGIFK